MSAVDIWLLPSHPWIGAHAAQWQPVHVDSLDEAVQVLAAGVNGQHYEIRECCHGDAS